MKNTFKQIVLIMSSFIISLNFPPITYASHYTLQTQIDDAKHGDVIRIPAGSHLGSLVIDKPIHLIGDNGAVLNGNRQDHSITIENTANVTIENVIIEGNAQPAKSAILIENSRNIKVDSVTIRNSYHGIYSLSSIDNSFTNNTIEGPSSHFSKKGNGIYLYRTQRNIIDNNKVTNVQDGFYIEEDDNVLITNNTVDSSRYGMHFMYSRNSNVYENTLLENVTGIMTMMTSNVEFSHNTIEDNIHYKGVGVVFYDVDRAQFHNNYMRNNSIGLSIQHSDNLMMQKNTIINNQIGLTLLKNNESNVFVENKMIGNIMQVKSDQGHAILSHLNVGNYWDDYEGLDMDGDGIGDTPYIPTSTYAYLVGAQPTFQYFFETPATVLMNQFDYQLVELTKERIKDEAPLMNSNKWEWNGFNISYSTMFIGILLLVMSFIIRKKAVI